MTIHAVLFDLDGTLLHTVPDLTVAINEMLKGLGRDPLPEAQVAIYVGKGAENLVHRSLTSEMNGRAPADLFAQAMVLWNTEYEKINGLYATLYPGVMNGLDALRDAGFSLGVVTNKPERYTLPLLLRTGLAEYFQVVVGGDTCALKKPNPMPMLHACSALGVKAAHTLMIGDSINDSLAAHAAGMRCWLLPYGYNEGRAPESTPCDAYVQTIQEAAEKLLKIQSQS